MRHSFIHILKMLTIAATLSLSAAGSGAAEETASMYSQEWSPYVTPADLAGLQIRNPDVQVIDIRHKKYVKKGIIPGAIRVPFAEWRGPKERPGQPPSEERLEALLGDYGMDLTQPIVVHNHTGKTIQTGRAAIVYWILKSSGAENVAILDGGFKAWKAAELPAEPEHAVPVPTSVDLTYRFDWWADPIDIFGVASGQAEGAILDARLDRQVRKSIKTGKPMQSMPMARFIPASFFTNHLSTQNMSQAGQEKFRADLMARGIDLGDGFLISVCQTGELSALSWFYASEIVGIEKSCTIQTPCRVGAAMAD